MIQIFGCVPSSESKKIRLGLETFQMNHHYSLMSDESEPEFPEMTAARIEAPSLEGVLEAIRIREAEVVRGAFQEGFRAGWEEAYKKVKEAFKQSSGAAEFNLIPPTIRIGTSTVIMRDLDGNQLSTHHSGNKNFGTKEIVGNFIARHPGLRGVDLIERIRSDGFELHERTVRTALHRLKKSDVVRVVDGRWYTSQSAPPNPQVLEKEEEEDAASS